MASRWRFSGAAINNSDLSGKDNSGLKDGADQTIEYEYDANDNMTSDKNKGLASIKYNYLNLPEEIIFEDDKSIVYTYNAAGVKLSQLVDDESQAPIKCTGYIN